MQIALTELPVTCNKNTIYYLPYLIDEGKYAYGFKLSQHSVEQRWKVKKKLMCWLTEQRTSMPQEADIRRHTKHVWLKCVYDRPAAGANYLR